MVLYIVILLFYYYYYYILLFVFCYKCKRSKLYQTVVVFVVVVAFLLDLILYFIYLSLHLCKVKLVSNIMLK